MTDSTRQAAAGGPDRAPARRSAAPLRPLHAVAAALDRLAAVVSGALLAGLVALVVVSVFFRYVLNSSLTWSEELGRYMSVWLVFTGMSVAYRRGEHVAVTSLVAMLPARGRAVAVRCVEALTFLLLLLLALLGWYVTADNFERSQVTPALGIEIAWIYLAIPVGFAITALHSLVRVLDPPPPEDTRP